MLCEGNAEVSIVSLLLENDRLLFHRDQLFLGDIYTERSAKEVEKRFLGLDFDKELVIVRICDSKNEKFRLTKGLYDHHQVINIITAPEIEILYIISKGAYDRYTNQYKSEMKPSVFCKREWKVKGIKSQQFFASHFEDIDHLIDVLRLYKRYSSSKERCLFDLLKSK